jgi:hypothetical protein
VEGRAVKALIASYGRARSAEERGGGRGWPPRAGRSGSVSGSRRNGPDSSHARLHSARRAGLARAGRGQTLGRGLGAVLTTGRGERRASAGAGREAARRAAAFSDTVAVCVAVSLSISGTATRRGSRAVTSAACSSAPASSTLGQRWACRESDDRQAKHERAKRGHVHTASFAGAHRAAQPGYSIRGAIFQRLMQGQRPQ